MNNDVHCSDCVPFCDTSFPPLTFNFLATTGPSGVRSLLLKQVGLVV